ncbi:hypothetical protein NLJ89_g6030 [Agrocybe chaxingu]|uniref:J domain-containing protein n=1 Tax=Agrocybe chaxingu TaxID=84603 RepID=A0A9W8K6D5_9AGAR|nr:hypothetical protein NLJ89_g6030 [Agrocybe chaxingu]
MGSSKVSDAYTVLGLEEGASLEVVKTTYKQVALRTHPDKNPDNPSATEEFQRVGEAYRVLVKHLDKSAPSSDRPRHAHPFYNFHRPESDDSFSDDEYYYEDDDYNDSDDEENMAFYLWLFEQMMGNRSPYARHDPRRPNKSPQKSIKNVSVGLVRSKLRHKRDGNKKPLPEKSEPQESGSKVTCAVTSLLPLGSLVVIERLDAERRQREKFEAKKAQAEAARKSSEERARALLQKAQEKRTSVFAAARRGNAEKVKKGVWEDGVDATGGEIKPDCASFVQTPPKDLQETLLHVAAMKGDVDLIKWLDSHSADPEERNSQGLTAFHLAVKRGHIAVIKYFLEAYPPDESDSKAIYDCSECPNMLSLALDSQEPEVVWAVLENKMATPEEVSNAWTWATSDKGSRILKGGTITPY